MDYPEQNRSFQRSQEDFQLNIHRRVSLSTSAETVTSERSSGDIEIQKSCPHIPCPPKSDKPKRPRPFCGHSPTSDNIINHGTSNFYELSEDQFKTYMTSDKCSTAEIDEKCFSKNQQIKDLRSAPHTLGFETSVEKDITEPVGKETTDQSCDADKKRKRTEKKDREAKRRTKKEEGDKVKYERIMADLSRNRSIFNGHKNTLPSIGEREPKVNYYLGKLPDIEEPEMLRKPVLDNNIVEVIRKHDAQVRTAAILRDMGHGYLNARAKIMMSHSENEAVSIIEKHEEQNGKSYLIFKERNTAGSLMSNSKQASARSRSSSTEPWQTIT